MQVHTTILRGRGLAAAMSLSSVLAIAAPGCMEYEPAGSEATFTDRAIGAGAPAYDQGSILVKFREVTTSAAIGDALALVGGSFQDADFDRRDDRFTRVAGGRLALVELTGKLRADEALKRLANHPAIEYAEPNWLQRAEVIPNDPSFGDLWGLQNTGQTGGTAGADISAPLAWDTSVGSHDVIVGVIDTGVDYTHPDLAANIFVNPNEIAGNGVDDDGNGYIDDVHGINAITDSGDPMDDHDHGTHVSGTIGAAGDNGAGVVGVNWNVSIMGLKFLSSSGSGTTADAIKCVDYAVDMKLNHGVDIRALSNSWGGGGFSQALEDAIVAADQAGILFVAAAGNSSVDNDSSPHYPSSYEVPNVLAVASTDHNDNLSSFSNFGATSVDLGAPGSSILSTVVGGGYATFSGTSMATPHVTGGAALVWSINDALTVAEVKNILMSTGDPIAALAGNTVSGNRLNVAAALDEANPVPGFKLDVSPASQTINQGEVATYDVSITSVLGFSDPVSLSLSSTPALDADVVFSPNPAAVDSTSTLSITTTTATAAGDYTLTITGTSGELTKSRTVTLTVHPEGTVVQSYTNSTAVSIPDNDPAGITSTIDVPDTLSIVELQVEVNITHTWIGDLIVELTSPSGTTTTLHDREGGSADNLYATYNPTAFDGENAAGTWTLSVSDNAGLDLGTLDSWTLTITGTSDSGPGNQPPAAGFTSSTSDLTASFTDTSTDSDGTVVAWSWDFGDGASSGAQHPTHTYAAAGTYTVTLTVTDDDGATDSVSQDVTVTEPPAQDMELTVTRARRNRQNHVSVRLSWTGGTTANVEIYRDGALIDVPPNEGSYRDRFRSSATSFVYVVCEEGGAVCSNEAVATP